MLWVSDRELVRQYIQGKESAFEVLLDRHKDKVYTHIHMMVKNEKLAEDIFQETFIKVVDTLKAGKYNEEGKFLPWVIKIAHNLVIDHYRKDKKMQMVHSTEEYNIFDFIEGDQKRADEVLADRNVRTLLKGLIADLPFEQKEVVIMRMKFKMSFKEIARRTNVSINTSLGRMRYAQINLKKMIEEQAVEVPYIDPGEPAGE